MRYSVVYILNRYLFRIYYFLYHWYVRGFRKFLNWAINYLEKLDYKFALRINLKNIFQPLFQDYSVIGHILGFISRFTRIVVASIIYAAFIVFCAVLFLVWALIPIFAIYQIITNFPY
ncbi:MAG: hypothetical protein AAB626_01750 [Patescibacteria group bacterium]